MFLFVLCILAGVAGTARTASALSLEEEEKLGREFIADIQKHYVLVEDEYACDYLNELGDYLSHSMKTRPFPLHFYLIQGNELNAFAGPGGHIFFFTGLIEAMEDVDELAAVMAHEMGHISARHLSLRIEQHKKLNVATLAGALAGVLLGGKAAQAIIMGTVGAAVQTQLAFSRADEREADQLGFATMRESGFDPAAMITVLKRMQGAQVYGTDEVPHLPSNPSHGSRVHGQHG